MSTAASDSPSPLPTDGAAAPTRIRLGVLVAPDVDPAAAAALDPAALAARLDAAYPGLAWDVQVSAEEVGDDDDDSLDLLEITRDRMLDEDWDVAVGLTGHALVQGPHTIAEQVSPVHSTGVTSLGLAEGDAPATVERVVARLLGLDPDEGEPHADDVRDAVRWARQLADDVEHRAGESGASFAGRVAGRNARMILGTVRANRPWMVAISLTRSMSTALATGALTLLTTDLWMLSAEYSGVQMAVLGALSIVAVTLSLVVGAKLWERPRRAAEREQVTVFNIATVLTVLIGVLVLHALLMLVALAGGLLLVDGDVFEEVTGDPATLWQYLKLAWFVGGLATIGSALGAGLEEADDVREAIFTRGSR